MTTVSETPTITVTRGFAHWRSPHVLEGEGGSWSPRRCLLLPATVGARRCGTSPRRPGSALKTVSRVVNEEPGVSAALAGRVRVAIDELDFRPNVGASSLRRSDGRTSSVALLLEDVANPYSAALQRAVEDVAVPRGVMVFSASLDEDPARERELARAFSLRRADGLILVPASDDQSYLASELRAGTAIVCVDREARRLAVDSVISHEQHRRRRGRAAPRRRRAPPDRVPRRPAATSSPRASGSTATGMRWRELGLPLDPALVVHDLRDERDRRRRGRPRC